MAIDPPPPSAADSAPGELPTPLVKTVICDDTPVRVVAEDKLGFEVYVRAVAAFLFHRETKTPLTMSVEGEWGSGKTSFLLQLQAVVAAAGSPTVFFNAWRHDKDESLWAAFALECVKAVRKRKPFGQRLFDDLRFTAARFDWNAALPDLFTLGFRLIVLAAIVALSAWLIMKGPSPGVVDASAKGLEKLVPLIAGAGGLLGSVFLLLAIAKKSKEVIGDPFEVKLRKYVADPAYKSRLAFVETFHEDFARVLRHYVEPEKLFIFIDDLDRCDVPRVAELMQAINMLTSSNVPGPVFVIGMDRKIVAASVAVKFQPLMPLLFPSGSPAAQAAAAQTDGALDYGYAFMEKFVQLPFRVPRARKEYLERLLEGTYTAPMNGVGLADAGDPLDSKRAQRVIQSAARLLDFNPRRIKQFINVFRLNVYLFVATDRLLGTPITLRDLPGRGELTLEKLGRFLAIILRWPRIVDALEDEPKLLNELQLRALDQAYEISVPVPEVWLNNAVLRQYLAEIENLSFPSVDWPPDVRRRIFSLEELDVKSLIEIAPTPRTDWTVRRPAQVVESSLDARLLLYAAGSPAMIRNRETSRHPGALDLVAPLGHGGLAHYRFDPADGERAAWRPLGILAPDKTFDSAAMLQSTYEGGNLELIARSGDELRLLFRRNRKDARWEWSDEYKFPAPGNPVFIQSEVGSDGNFELIVPVVTGGLAHYWRNNRENRRPWLEEVRFAQTLARAVPIALFETTRGNESDLTVFVASGVETYAINRENYTWGAPKVLQRAPSLAPGRFPAMLRRGKTQEFDVFVPLPNGGVGHYAYDRTADTWVTLATFGIDLGRVEAIAAVGDAARYDLVVRCGSAMYHVVYDVKSKGWSAPKAVADGGGQQTTDAA